MAQPADRPERLVEAGYDRIAKRYVASKQPLGAAAVGLLARLVDGLPAGAPVLDLGCGAGVPVTGWLAQHYHVTGVDLSARQLALARQHVPTATFLKADMTAVAFPATSFGAIVACYSIVHVPRHQHQPLLTRIHDWLWPGCRFLATWPLTAWEGQEANWLGWGTPMWWSHFDWETNLTHLRQANFSIEAAELLDEGEERWLWVLATKSA